MVTVRADGGAEEADIGRHLGHQAEASAAVREERGGVERRARKAEGERSLPARGWLLWWPASGCSVGTGRPWAISAVQMPDGSLCFCDVEFPCLSAVLELQKCP